MHSECSNADRQIHKLHNIPRGRHEQIVSHCDHFREFISGVNTILVIGDRFHYA